MTDEKRSDLKFGAVLALALAVFVAAVFGVVLLGIRGDQAAAERRLQIYNAGMSECTKLGHPVAECALAIRGLRAP